MIRFFLSAAATTLLCGTLSATVSSTLINLTQTEVNGIAAQTEASIGEGDFIISSIGASGSGVLRRWYGLQDDNDCDAIEYGYNYDGSKKLPMDQKQGGVADPNLQIQDLNTLVIDDKEYVEFVLDVNENDKLISLDSFKLYVYDDPFTSPYITDKSNLNQLGNLVYDMDAFQDHTILIEETGSGSGSTDLTVLVNKDVLDGYSGDSKLYLFSQLGGAGVMYETNNGAWTKNALNFGVSNGFEEWGFRERGGDYTPIPEASTVVTGSMLAIGALGFAWMRRRRKAS